MGQNSSALKGLSEIAGGLQKVQDEFLSVAEMQRHIMPNPERLTVFGDYDIFGKTLPNAVVGGDFYDFMDLEGRFGMNGRMGIVIADAVGHGLAAAMLIRDFNTALYTAISFESHYAGDTTPLLFRKINRRMFRSSQHDQFITAFYGELHLDGTLRYINAGHFSPLLFRQEEIVSLDTGGLVLGAFRTPPVDFQVGEAHMDVGDALLCYTDGIIESLNSEDHEYGVERLKKLVHDCRIQPSRATFDAILRDIEAFSKDAQSADDRTVIVIRRMAPGRREKGSRGQLVTAPDGGW